VVSTVVAFTLSVTCFAIHLLTMTSQIGLLRGTTIELERAVPEMDGQRVRVVLEPFEERQVSGQQQREFWQAWVANGPNGPIEEGTDTDLP
jgi:hypothetical protein